MVSVHDEVWIYITLVLSVLVIKVMAQDPSTIAPSSENTMSLSTQTSSTTIGISTPSLSSHSNSALITNLPVVTTSILVDHGTVSSSVNTIQPTATASDIKVSSVIGFTLELSTEHLVLTSSLIDGEVATSIPSVSVQATLGTKASITIAGSSQVISSSSASPVSVSLVPSASSIVRASSLTSDMVPNSRVTTVIDSHDSSLLTSSLPSSTRIVSETLSTHLSFTPASFQSSPVTSEMASSSLPLSLSSMPHSLVTPSLASSVSPSLTPSSSAVIVSVDMSSPSNATTVNTVLESVRLQATSVTSSAHFSSIISDNMSISSSTLAQAQSSVSHLTSFASSLLPSSSSHEVINIQTTRTNPETALAPSSPVLTLQTQSVVLPTPMITSLESYQSHMTQSVIFEQAISSSVGKMTFATSPQETVIPTVTSAQSDIMTSTTSDEIVVVPSLSVQRPHTSVLPEPFSTIESTASSSHVEISTSVVATPKSSLLEHSTSPSPEHSVTPWLPTLIARNISFEIEFKGVCNPLVQRKIVLEIFWEELVITIAKTLHIDKAVIKPKDIACRPIRISFVIMETMLANVTQTLKTLVASGDFKFKIPVSVGGSESKYQYEALSVKQVPLDYDIAGTPDLYEIGLNKVDIIVIIVACCVSFILICIGCCICLREYYIRKRSRSFDLSDIVNFNLKLEDYTLTKIPRNKPFYSDNAVKMQSFTRKNGQQTKSLLEQEENCNCDDVNVRKEVKVRMNSHSDGIVIGVTATNIPDVVTNHQTPHDDQTDQSKEILFENESSPTHCMDNPIYFADDDRFTSV